MGEGEKREREKEGRLHAWRKGGERLQIRMISASFHTVLTLGIDLTGEAAIDDRAVGESEVWPGVRMRYSVERKRENERERR